MNKIKAAIAKAITENVMFFAYRLPGDNRNITFGVDDNSDKEYSMEFVVHPFSEINYEKERTIKARINSPHKFLLCKTNNDNKDNKIDVNETFNHEEYIDTINKSIDYIKKGDCKKIVISNTKFLQNNISPDRWAETFIKLIDSYPYAYVFMFRSNDSNVWLGASPEKLASYHENTFCTMSLAGTRQANTISEWGKKEIEEQKIVTDFITKTLESLSIKPSVSSTFTKNAGNIEHICNTITCNDIAYDTAIKAVKELHPTPALSGLPKEKAIDFIESIEKHSRKYYGGYCGPLIANDNRFEFYVILRCLQFNKKTICLYTGGGITEDSIAESEWIEIDNKARTLLDKIQQN